MTTSGSGHTPSQHAHDHDDPARWQQPAFVQEWVDRDDGRRDEREPMIKETIEAIPFEQGASINVLDIGAGYGILSREVLENFPNAHVTLQDVSEPMFDHARKRLESHSDRASYVQSDFSQRDWASKLGGPFHVAVSAIAIHNMYDDGLIASVYKDIHDILEENGVFVNLDYAAQAGGVESHVTWLKEAGFKNVEAVLVNARVARLIASR